jgi:hypothetical protein
MLACFFGACAAYNCAQLGSSGGQQAPSLTCCFAAIAVFRLYWDSALHLLFTDTDAVTVGNSSSGCTTWLIRSSATRPTADAPVETWPTGAFLRHCGLYSHLPLSGPVAYFASREVGMLKPIRGHAPRFGCHTLSTYC